MNIREQLSVVPEKAYILIFLGVFLFCSFSVYFLIDDTRLIEKKITSKQKDLSAVLSLRDSYESKKRMFEKYSSKKVEAQPISLALIEDMVKKNFVGGKLVMLQPGSMKEEKGKQQMAVEMKVAGAALGEVVAFLKAAEVSGLSVKKLRMSLPANNPTTIDIQATITERYSHA